MDSCNLTVNFLTAPKPDTVNYAIEGPQFKKYLLQCSFADCICGDQKAVHRSRNYLWGNLRKIIFKVSGGWALPICPRSIKRKIIKLWNVISSSVSADPWSASELPCKTGDKWECFLVQRMARVWAEARNRRSLGCGWGRDESARTADCSFDEWRGESRTKDDINRLW